MIMKKLICLTFIAFVTSSILAQTQPMEHEWKATVKVADETGNPVANAHVGVGYFSGGAQGIDGVTDTNGIFVATHRSVPGLMANLLSFRVEKNGYYSTWSQTDLGPGYSPNKWIVIENIVLKRIGEPVAMYAKKEETKVLQEDKPIGFDLEAGDWVTPYGEGFHSDMFFSVHRKIIATSEYDCTLTVTFPNKGDGIVIAPSEPDTGSDFKTSRTAAENGYQPELVLHYSNTDQPPGVFGYFIRVRTELKQDGTIQSALYGKIAGGFRFYAGTKAPRAGMGFDYYLNPTPNDRDVEFDPKNNLIKNLSFIERIKEP
jgi:hypothetical protein